MPAIPKPEHELARPRKRKGKDQVPVTVGERRKVSLKLKPEPDWHPIAKQIFEAALNSGQADFYQDSDIAILYSLCEDISVYKSPKWKDHETGEIVPAKRSGQMLQAIMSNLASLLLTEGDRRRVRLELQAPPETPPDLKMVAMSEYRDVAKAHKTK